MKKTRQLYIPRVCHGRMFLPLGFCYLRLWVGKRIRVFITWIASVFLDMGVLSRRLLFQQYPIWLINRTWFHFSIMEVRAKREGTRADWSNSLNPISSSSMPTWYMHSCWCHHFCCSCYVKQWTHNASFSQTTRFYSWANALCLQARIVAKLKTVQ